MISWTSQVCFVTILVYFYFSHRCDSMPSDKLVAVNSTNHLKALFFTITGRRDGKGKWVTDIKADLDGKTPKSFVMAGERLEGGKTIIHIQGTITGKKINLTMVTIDTFKLHIS